MPLAASHRVDTMRGDRGNPRGPTGNNPQGLQNMSTRNILAAAAMLTCLAAATTVQAGVTFGIGIGIPAYPYRPYYPYYRPYGVGVYVAPGPAYYYPPPAYYAPRRPTLRQVMRPQRIRSPAPCRNSIITGRQRRLRLRRPIARRTIARRPRLRHRRPTLRPRKSFRRRPRRALDRIRDCLGQVGCETAQTAPLTTGLYICHNYRIVIAR